MAASGLAWSAEVPLVVDAGLSQVSVEVHATVDSFTAQLAGFESEIWVDPATAQVRRAQVQFHFTDVVTGKDDRDEQMHTWQDTPHYPDGSFRLSTLTPDGGGMVATGMLTLHGQAREIRFPVAVTHDADLYAIDGVAPLDTRDFGLPIIRKFMVLKVDPLVQVRFHLQGRLAAQPAQ